jgi:hypothetical protein
VLLLLRRHPLSLKTFNANKVGYISCLYKSKGWKYPSTCFNPSDFSLWRSSRLQSNVPRDMILDYERLLKPSTLEKNPASCPILEPVLVIAINQKGNFNKHLLSKRDLYCERFILLQNGPGYCNSPAVNIP